VKFVPENDSRPHHVPSGGCWTRAAALAKDALRPGGPPDSSTITIHHLPETTRHFHPPVVPAAELKPNWLHAKWRFLLFAAALIIVEGCAPPSASSNRPSAPATSTATAIPASGITATSTPTEAAEAVLAAMKGDSMKAIEQMVASRKVNADV
jgi:hypothetical protein